MSKIMKKIAQLFALAIVAAALMFITAFLSAIPFQWLWNVLMPDIFGLTEITFWQAFGLNIFAGIIFNNSNSSSKDK